MKIADPVIDTELESTDNAIGANTPTESISTARNVRDSLRANPLNRSSVFLPESGLTNAKKSEIPYCTATIAQRSKDKQYILDSVPYLPEISQKTFEKHVQDLARKLAGTDPLSFGLLKCRGVVQVFNQHQEIVAYDLVFYFPPTLQDPRSLRSILLTAQSDTSLSARFFIAQQLARSVSYIHTYGFVHKSVRPDTALVFESDSSFPYSFLLGFEKFRPEDRHTIRAGDDDWEKDLYRHPRRQGLRPQDEYVMQHDIYSLGVCMLEVGLWQSFIMYGGDKLDATPSQILPVVDIQNNNIARRADMLKDALVTLAKKELPRRMGDKYTAIVVSCLTCLDEENPDFSDEHEFTDEDDVLIGVRYIEKVRS